MSCKNNDHDFSEKRDRNCGVQICYECGEHKGLVRCFCGWSKSGRDGYAELREWGENIEDDY